jgi:hypothetical protein
VRQIISKKIVCSDAEWTSESALSNYGLETSWKEWLFEESRRRLAVVYRVVNMLVYFEPASLCELQRDLVLAPLPAKKQLWEANSALAWKETLGVQDLFALAANGELVELENCKSFCGKELLRYKPLNAGTPSRNNVGWEEWCSGMDGFGGLIMLAASLVG